MLAVVSATFGVRPSAPAAEESDELDLGFALPAKQKP